MELKLVIKMTPNALYDFLLYHIYTSFQGILGAVVGALLIVVFFMGESPIYLVCGLVVEAYLPYTLFLRSRQQFVKNPVFKEELHYTFDDEGMMIEQGENSEKIAWEEIRKAVSTPGSIVLYTSNINGSIFPKKQLGDKKDGLVKMVSTHMEPKKVKIRG